MSTLYVIAGPPGIGKSTSGHLFIPNHIKIFDPDSIAIRYRDAGFVEYKDIGDLRFRDLVRKELFAGNDFAIELNLGFKSHYDYVQNLKRAKDCSIALILYFTDDINICYKRVKERYVAGLHLVPENVIKEMYDNTIDLLMKYFFLFDQVFAINVEGNTIPELCLELNKKSNLIDEFGSNLPDWLNSHLIQFFYDQLNSEL